MHYIDAELAWHVHKIDVKLQSLCGSGFSLFAACILTKLYHFGVNWPTTLCEHKDGVHLCSQSEHKCTQRYICVHICV